MAEMAVSQPKDGIDFLGQWLQTYAEQEATKATRDKEERALADEREKNKVKLEEKEKLRQLKVVEQERLESVYHGLLGKFSDPEVTFQDSFWTDLVNVTQESTGASAVYLGLLDEEGEGESGPYISYEAFTKGSELLADKILPKETGVTWGALTENPAEEDFAAKYLWKPPSVEPVAAEPVEGEEPPEKPTVPYYPVSIPCVTDVKEVHYFEMTRLGAFLALPLVYQSYYTSDAYADAKTFEDEKKAEAKKREEEAAAAAAAAEAGEAVEGEAEKPAEAEPVEVKKMVLRGKAVKMVLCLDTLGTNKAFEESAMVRALELCKACGQCKSQTEIKEVDNQALAVIDEALRAAMEEQVAAAVTAAETSTAEALANEDAEAPEERKDLLQKKYAFLRALETAKAAVDVISSLHSWVVVPAEVLSVLAAAALMFGFTKEEIYPKRKQVLQWEKFKTLLAKPADFLGRASKAEFEGARKGLKPEEKLSYFKQMATPAEMDQEKANEISPAFALIFSLVQAACAYRNADLEMRKASVGHKLRSLLWKTWMTTSSLEDSMLDAKCKCEVRETVVHMLLCLCFESYSSSIRAFRMFPQPGFGGKPAGKGDDGAGAMQMNAMHMQVAQAQMAAMQAAMGKGGYMGAMYPPPYGQDFQQAAYGGWGQGFGGCAQSFGGGSKGSDGGAKGKGKGGKGKKGFKGGFSPLGGRDDDLLADSDPRKAIERAQRQAKLRDRSAINQAQRTAQQRFEKDLLDRVQGNWVDEADPDTSYLVEGCLCSVSGGENARTFRNRLGVYGGELCWDARRFWHNLNLNALPPLGEEVLRVEWNPAEGSPPTKQIVWVKGPPLPEGGAAKEEEDEPANEDAADPASMAEEVAEAAVA
ncbi:unnamed protein product [Polarella glacialis]|uniref:Uncharacterized protein n=1 Tax=Polarella glacialis TaxID=89957 RepID=A0A813EUD9_POLGL|nr:unnamed protein product [Polarella glacialis]